MNKFQDYILETKSLQNINGGTVVNWVFVDLEKVDRTETKQKKGKFGYHYKRNR